MSEETVEKPEIPAFQYEGLGRHIVDLLKRHKGDWPVKLTVELLDYKRTLVVTDADMDRAFEITARYPWI